jgi:hypothetical protein
MQAARIATTIAWGAGAKDVDERSFLPVYFDRPMTEEQIRRELEKLGGLFQPKDG